MSYTLPSFFQAGLWDRVCLYKLPHLQPHDHVAHVWTEVTAEERVRVTFPVSTLPQEESFYKIQYLKDNIQVAGASEPFQLRLSDMCQLEFLIKDKLELEQTLAQARESMGRTENDLNITREELVNAEQSLKEKEYKIFELENKLENRDSIKGKLYDETIARGNLLKERDSLKSKLDNEIVVREHILKEKRDLEDSSAKERDSLKMKLDDEIEARENILKEKRDLEDASAKERDSRKMKLLSLSIILTLMISCLVFLAIDRDNLNGEVENLKSKVENLLKEKTDLEYSMAHERDNLKRKLDDQILSHENLLREKKELEIQLFRMTGTYEYL